MTALLHLLLLWLVVSPASAQDDPPAPPAAPAWALLEDPRLVEAEAEEALARGDDTAAQQIFEHMLAQMEVSQYLGYREMLKNALVFERMGKFDEATAQYRKGMDNDIHRTIGVLRIMSVHPQREDLVQEAYARVRELALAAQNGEQAQIYTTSKGAPRYLTPMTTEEVLEQARAGKMSRYCYVEDFDLTEVADEDIPPSIHLERCVIGRIYAPDKSFRSLKVKAIILGDVVLGKDWEGAKNRSKVIPPSGFHDLYFRESIFLGAANFAGVTVDKGGRAYFPMTVFETMADFKGAEFTGVSEFRFSSFGAGADFKHIRLYDPVYFGGSRFRADTVFTHMYSEHTIYFNSTEFEGLVEFDNCEWLRDATFEDARFRKNADFETTSIEGSLNFSRAQFDAVAKVKALHLGNLSALGTWFKGPAFFQDSIIEGRTRFAVDANTRREGEQDVSLLLRLYRTYQGDEDADEPLVTTSSYGVRGPDDLEARIDDDISFANTEFRGYTVFEGVTFGKPGEDSVSSFYNAQLLGETHFEGTEWHGQADFTTIFGVEVAFNRAVFNRSLILDDMNIQGRINLSDVVFTGNTDLSLYKGEARAFEISAEQVDMVDEPHRLFYERCAMGTPDRSDIRIQRLETWFGPMDDGEIRQICYAYLVDELVALRSTYGDRAMIHSEDMMYWWMRYHMAREQVEFGTPLEKVSALVFQIGLFEYAFGWGVKLQNLAVSVALISLLFAIIYRLFCGEAVLSYDGEEVPIKEVPFTGLMYVSLQSLMGFNTGWDFGHDYADHRFRYLNTFETTLGFVAMTFFVGAYTRMILA